MRLFLIGLLATLAFQLQAHVLIIQFSDTQSQYDNIKTFINTISNRMEKFKQRYPKGKIVILANGDIGGKSLFSEIDGGDLDYQVLASFSKDIPVVLNLGPGQAFDFQNSLVQEGELVSGYRSNLLFVSQNKKLSDSMKRRNHPFSRILKSNVDLNSERFSSKFVDFYDFDYLESMTLRFYGLTSRDFFEQSEYRPQSSLKIFDNKEIPPYVKTVKEKLIEANKSGIDRVVFAVHDDYAKVFKGGTVDIEQFIKDKNLAVQVSFVATAGDSAVKGGINGTYFTQSGRQYSFSEIILNETLDVKETRVWPLERQKKLKKVKPFTPYLEELKSRVNRFFRKNGNRCQKTLDQ